jgi:hypothetical protein
MKFDRPRPIHGLEIKRVACEPWSSKAFGMAFTPWARQPASSNERAVATGLRRRCASRIAPRRPQTCATRHRIRQRGLGRTGAALPGRTPVRADFPRCQHAGSGLAPLFVSAASRPARHRGQRGDCRSRRRSGVVRRGASDPARSPLAWTTPNKCAFCKAWAATRSRANGSACRFRRTHARYSSAAGRPARRNHTRMQT